MNKKIFLGTLVKELSILKISEREDIVKEYSQHIDDEVSKGKTEEEAVANFGNIKDLVMDILDAYNIDSSVVNKNGNIIEKTIYHFKKFMDKVSDTIDSLPKGRNVGAQILNYSVYVSFWGILLTGLIFFYKVLGYVLGGVFGGFGVFVMVSLIIVISIIMLIILYNITLHVFSKKNTN